MSDAPDTPAQLKARALRFLVRREHTRAELARKLAPRAESAEALERLLDELVARKQLSDERYAEERARVLARKFGAARVRFDLRAKGIAGETTERLAAAAAASDLERARAIITRRYRTPVQGAEERARRARFLQGRGFSSEVIRRVLGASEEDTSS